MYRIVTIGDSWSSAYESGDSDAGWPSILRLLNVDRHAVAGSTLDEWASHYLGLPNVQEAIHQADAVVGTIGGNDLRPSLDDGFQLGDIGRALYVAQHLRRFWYTIRSMASGRVLCLSYADPWFGKVTGVRMFVDLFCKSCSGIEGVEFIDLRGVLAQSHFDGKDFHPNTLGHHAIARVVKALTIDADA